MENKMNPVRDREGSQRASISNGMNWGTLVLGIVIGAVVVGVVWMASKPATTGAQVPEDCLNEVATYVECVKENQGPAENCDYRALVKTCGWGDRF